jgi:predicted secreted protein
MKIPFLRLTCHGLLLLAGLMLGPVAAADDKPLTYDRISLQAAASAEVGNDILVAVLFAQREGDNAQELAAEVNSAIAWGLEIAKAQPEVQSQTLDYSTAPVYDKQRLTGWRVSQQLRLRSENAAALSELIGQLQERLAVRSIDYRLSPDKRSAAERQLVVQAIASFKRRAALVAEQFERPDYRLVALQVNTGSEPIRMRAVRAAAMSADAAVAPVMEAGTQRVEVHVSGSIELVLP